MDGICMTFTVIHMANIETKVVKLNSELNKMNRIEHKATFGTILQLMTNSLRLGG